MSNTISKNAFVKLQKHHGVIDVNNLSSGLQQAMQAAGVSAAELAKVAGTDGQIKGKAEFKKLYTVLDGFDSKPGDGKLQIDGAAGELEKALKAEVKANHQFAQYRAPGAKAAPKQPKLTVANDALVVPASERKPTVDLGVRLQRQTEYEELHNLPNSTGCRATAEAGINEFVKKNFDPAPKLVKRNDLEKNIQVGYAEDKNGRVAVDETQAKVAREYIDRALDAGLPVMVGASYKDYKQNKGNADNLTEHWVSITGRDYDDQGRLFYSFNDPGNGKKGRFYVDQDTGKLFKVAEHRNDSTWAANSFEMAQVRPYENF
jgi:hypothetical protein